MRALLSRLAVVFVVLAFASAAAADTPSQDTIVTVAQVAHPRGLAVLPDGSVLVAEPFMNDVRRVLPDGSSTIVAGTGIAGHQGDGGPAVAAQLNLPHGVALLPDGSFVIADAVNHRIRRVAPDGTISTIVGDGKSGFAGDGGPATEAEISTPRGIAALPDGTLLIPDSDNSRIREVTPDGTITTIAGDGTAGSAGDGGPATSAELDLPFSVAPLPDGGFLVADPRANRIRRVAPDGTITTVAGTGVRGYSGDGKLAVDAEIDQPHTMLPLPNGGFLIADTVNNRIRRVWPDGIITTTAGTGTPGYTGDGQADTVELNQPKALALLPDGRILVGDAANDRLRTLTLAPIPPPRIATLLVRDTTELDIRFRVCDSSHDTLKADFTLAGAGHSRALEQTLASTRGGCLPFRLTLPRRGTSTITLRIQDDQQQWSPARKTKIRLQTGG